MLKSEWARSSPHCPVLIIPKGYLDIVRWLCENGGATGEANGAPGVDIRSKGGWTPLSMSNSYRITFGYGTDSC